jgi:hypothetical protein
LDNENLNLDEVKDRRPVLPCPQWGPYYTVFDPLKSVFANLYIAHQKPGHQLQSMLAPYAVLDGTDTFPLTAREKEKRSILPQLLYYRLGFYLLDRPIDSDTLENDAKALTEFLFNGRERKAAQSKQSSSSVAMEGDDADDERPAKTRRVVRNRRDQSFIPEVLPALRHLVIPPKNRVPPVPKNLRGGYRRKPKPAPAPAPAQDPVISTPVVTEPPADVEEVPVIEEAVEEFIVPGVRSESSSLESEAEDFEFEQKSPTKKRKRGTNNISRSANKAAKVDIAATSSPEMIDSPVIEVKSAMKDKPLALKDHIAIKDRDYAVHRRQTKNRTGFAFFIMVSSTLFNIFN